jgi:hypothetical protein
VPYLCFTSPHFVLNITDKGAELITASGVDELWRWTSTSWSEQVCTPGEGKVGVVERMTISPLEVTIGVNEVFEYRIYYYRLTFFIPPLTSDDLSRRSH